MIYWSLNEAINLKSNTLNMIYHANKYIMFYAKYTLVAKSIRVADNSYQIRFYI